MLTTKLNKIKSCLNTVDAYGDAADDLRPIFENHIDSVKKSKNVLDLLLLKKWVYDNDLFYSDEELIKESGLFDLIDEIINSYI